MTQKESVALVSMLLAAYPRMETPKATIKLYQGFLQDLDFNLAKAAITKHIATSQYFPTVAEIREAAFSMTDTAPMAADAWTEVLNKVSRIGTYGSPEFSHPAITGAVKALGWRNLCLSENIGVERAHFMRIYGEYRKRETEKAKVLPILERLGLASPELFALPAGDEQPDHIDERKKQVRELYRS